LFTFIDKNSHVEALYANSYGRKSRKKSLGKENKKNRPKEERKSSILSRKEKNLAKSDKGSWFGQTPLTVSASAEYPEHSNILGASGLNIKVNFSAGCEQDSLSESSRSDEEKE